MDNRLILILSVLVGVLVGCAPGGQQAELQQFIGGSLK